MGGIGSVTVWLPSAFAMGAVLFALVMDAFDRRGVALLVLIVGLAGAAGAAVWSAQIMKTVLVAGWFATGAGFSTLPALGYFLAACSVLGGYRALSAQDRGVATAALVAMSAVFSHALMASLDTLVTLVCLAALSVSGYALVAAAGTRRADESALRYLVQGVVASGLAVYGLGLLFAIGGTGTAYVDIGAALANDTSRPLLLALGLVVSAFAFKVGAFPFHSWMPDVYETADHPVAAYLASTPKIAGIVGMMVIVRFTVFQTAVAEAALEGPLLALALGSLLIGTLGMLRQRSVARLLGYSAIAQVGYAVAGVAIGDAGIRAAVLLIATYAMGACAAFLTLEAIRRVRPGWDGSLEGLAGLAARSPLVAGVLTVVMMSLTGIPLFAGFWGKLLLIASAATDDRVWLGVVAGVASVVSFASYGSVIRHAYFEGADGSDGDEPVHMSKTADDGGGARSSGGMPAVVGAGLAVLLIVGGIAPLVWGVQSLYALFSLG